MYWDLIAQPRLPIFAAPMKCWPFESHTQLSHQTTYIQPAKGKQNAHIVRKYSIFCVQKKEAQSCCCLSRIFSKNGVLGFTSVTLPEMTVNDRDEYPALSNPAVCKGHPHMLTSSIADLYNVQWELKIKPSYNALIANLSKQRI